VSVGLQPGPFPLKSVFFCVCVTLCHLLYDRKRMFGYLTYKQGNALTLKFKEQGLLRRYELQKQEGLTENTPL